MFGACVTLGFEKQNKKKKVCLSGKLGSKNIDVSLRNKSVGRLYTWKRVEAWNLLRCRVRIMNIYLFIISERGLIRGDHVIIYLNLFCELIRSQTCSRTMPGSLGHEEHDARTFASMCVYSP